MPLPRYYSLTEIAKQLGISTHTLRQRIKESGLSLYRPGGSPVLSEGDLIVLLESTRGREGGGQPSPTGRERREQIERARQVRLVRLTNEGRNELLAQYAAKPIAQVAQDLRMTVQTLRNRIHDAGLRPARMGRTYVLNEVEVKELIDFSRSRGRVYWKDPDWLRPPKKTKAPKPPLTRKELADRIRAGKEAAQRMREEIDRRLAERKRLAAESRRAKRAAKATQ